MLLLQFNVFFSQIDLLPLLSTVPTTRQSTKYWPQHTRKIEDALIVQEYRGKQENLSISHEQTRPTNEKHYFKLLFIFHKSEMLKAEVELPSPHPHPQKTDAFPHGLS